MTKSPVEGIELIHDPPPQLKKAMEWRWAKELRDSGVIRLTSVLEYRKPNPDKPWQSDPYEDIQIERNNGVVCRAESATPPFVWCSATLDADSDRLLEVDPDYDTIVTILNPAALFQRISDAVRLSNPWAGFQVGLVAYNKGGPSTPYFWGKCTFQKGREYSYQNEYRLAFYEPSGRSHGKAIMQVYKEQPHVDLKIGCCGDILTAERFCRTLPSRRQLRA
jgi:hypothetical protein